MSFDYILHLCTGIEGIVTTEDIILVLEVDEVHNHWFVSVSMHSLVITN